jgi:LPS-assembly protein
VVVLLGSVTWAHAQLGAFNLAREGVNMAVQKGLAPPSKGVEDPLQPKGFPGLPPKFGDLPDPASEDLKFRIIRTGLGGRVGNDVDITEGAEFWYKGFHVYADEVDGSLQTNIFTLRKNVKIIGKDSTVVGDRVTVNFNNSTYLAQDAESQLDPGLVNGILRDDLYIKAQESYGSERQIWGHNADITTCNLKEPHYHLDSKDIEIRPGKRAILRHTKIKLFGHTILSVAYLNIPLDDRTFRYTPEIGQSEDEGYFIKTRWGIPLKGDNQFDSRVDYMTKLGTGLGGDYRYFNRTMNGIARIYTITGKSNTFTLTNDHRQEFRWGTVSLNNDYQKNNYLTAPGTTILNTRAQVVLPQRNGASTRLSFNQTGSQSQGFDTTNRSISVSDQRTFGRNTRTTLDLNWLKNGSAFQGQPSSDREQVDVRMRATHELRVATANLEYVRSIPVGEQQGIFGGSDRTPFVSLTSDARKLLGSKFGEQLPFSTELSLGEFSTITNAEQNKISRYNLDFRFNRPDRSDKRLRVDLGGQFRQGMYSDDTAQYTQGVNANASYRLGRDTSANFRYNYLRQHGYSPLLIDRTGRTNLFTTDLSYRPVEPFLVGVQSGYDFLRLERQDTAWQQVGLRTEYTPRDNVLFRTLSTYDTFQRQWSNVRLDFAYRHNDQFLGIGARYDGLRKVWSNANLYLENFQYGRVRISAILSYNGFTKQFDSQQYSFIYDLHCAEAILIYTQQNTGFRSGKDVSLFIRLKAIPFDLPFGFGRRGQPLGSPGGIGF